MLWKEVLDRWSNGGYHTYPKNIGKFMWNTSVLKPNAVFNESFKTNRYLQDTEDYSAFQKHINNNNDKYAIAFPNLSNDAILVIPTPKKNKNYASIKSFIDTAPLKQQKMFWKKVATVAKKEMKKHGKVWISTSGMGVPYLHVRISITPKYYFDDSLL